MAPHQQETCPLTGLQQLAAAHLGVLRGPDGHTLTPTHCLVMETGVLLHGRPWRLLEALLIIL
jgi:hypothetical protein